jgi:pimeloyl-ACP methyl ester carboxylesterase
MPKNDYADEWYLPIENGAGSLYLVETGEGPTTLVVHGGPGHDHGYLRDAFEPFESELRFVFFDQRGCLRSPLPLSLVDFDRTVNDLFEIVAALGGDPVRIVGHSMGCIVVGAALARGKEAFREVLLINPGPLSATQSVTGLPDRSSDVLAEIEAAGLSPEPASIKEATWQWRIRFAAANLHHIDRWRQLAGGGAFYNAEVGAAVSSTMPDYDFWPTLQSHGHRVTLAVGASDFIDPGGTAARSHEGGALSVSVVPDAGHNMWIDAPSAFADILRSALA